MFRKRATNKSLNILLFAGAAFNETIEEALLDVQIEDLWIPYFCITTDISASKMRVHTTGKIMFSSLLILFCE